jgi:glycosyltransferase involved in cell wall biosynthesis/SAM-dependent methyltransferase
VTAQRRYLFVIHYPVFGGPHNQALRLATPLAEAGWDTVVLLPDEPGNSVDRLRESGIEVVTAPLSRIRATPDVRRHVRMAAGARQDVRTIRRIAREQEADLVLLGGLANPQAAIAGRAEERAVVWQLLDTRLPLAARAAYFPLLAHYADALMVTGSRVAAVHPGVPSLGERTVSFFPPVDRELFKADPAARAAAREELGIPANATVVGTAGNLNPMKGHRTFIRAAARLHEERPELRFLILGADYSYRTEYSQSLWAEAEQLGLRLGDSLVVRDPANRLPELAQALDVFLLTSEPRSEGLPTVIGEVMSLGAPVVAADVGGVADAVSDGENGFVVPARDVDAFVAATERLLDDDALAARFRAATAQGAEQFSVEASAAAHLEAFELAATRAAVRRATGLGTMTPQRPGEAGDLRSLLACPVCRGELAWSVEGATCRACGAEYELADGIPVLLPPSDGDAWKEQQAAFFDEADEAYEISRPHGTGSLYSWLLGEKFRRSLAGLPAAAPGTVVLTVCGGSGLDAEYLARAGYRVIASDISLEAARRTRERAERHGLQISPLVADVEALPFRDRSVDLVYVHDGLHHLEAPLNGLNEMLRTARRAISVNEPARAQATLLAARVGLAEHYEDAGNFIARLDPGEIDAIVREAGFDVVKSERYAMLYRHEPGKIARLLSSPGLFGATRNGSRLLNAVAGGYGNKMTVRAVRREAD